MAEEIAPHFVMELQSYTVKESEAISLQCQVEGTPQPEVHWYKDGKEVKPDKTHKIEKLAEGLEQLTIFKTSKADVGEYTAEAVNVAGTAKTIGELKSKFKLFYFSVCGGGFCETSGFQLPSKKK